MEINNGDYYKAVNGETVYISGFTFDDKGNGVLIGHIYKENSPRKIVGYDIAGRCLDNNKSLDLVKCLGNWSMNPENLPEAIRLLYR